MDLLLNVLEICIVGALEKKEFIKWGRSLKNLLHEL
jgi:hypothetical protein